MSNNIFQVTNSLKIFDTSQNKEILYQIERINKYINQISCYQNIEEQIKAIDRNDKYCNKWENLMDDNKQIQIYKIRYLQSEIVRIYDLFLDDQTNLQDVQGLDSQDIIIKLANANKRIRFLECDRKQNSFLQSQCQKENQNSNYNSLNSSQYNSNQKKDNQSLKNIQFLQLQQQNLSLQKDINKLKNQLEESESKFIKYNEEKEKQVEEEIKSINLHQNWFNSSQYQVQQLKDQIILLQENQQISQEQLIQKNQLINDLKQDIADSQQKQLTEQEQFITKIQQINTKNNYESNSIINSQKLSIKQMEQQILELQLELKDQLNHIHQYQNINLKIQEEQQQKLQLEQKIIKQAEYINYQDQELNKQLNQIQELKEQIQQLIKNQSTQLQQQQLLQQQQFQQISQLHQLNQQLQKEKDLLFEQLQQKNITYESQQNQVSKLKQAQDNYIEIIKQKEMKIKNKNNSFNENEFKSLKREVEQKQCEIGKLQEQIEMISSEYQQMQQQNNNSSLYDSQKQELLIMEEAKWTAEQFIQLLEEVRKMNNNQLYEKYEMKVRYLETKIGKWSNNINTLKGKIINQSFISNPDYLTITELQEEKNELRRLLQGKEQDSVEKMCQLLWFLQIQASSVENILNNQ